MTVASVATPSILPPAPTTLAESGLTQDLLVELALKTLHFSGELSGADMAERLALRFPIIESALEQLRAQQQIQIAGGSLVGRPAFRYRITDAGRTRAALFLESSQYVGAAPIPLGQYQKYMRDFGRVARHRATRDEISQGFSHLVVHQRVLDQLGPAINAGHSMFVYGPPGNGKTVISQAIGRLLVGGIAIPHAIEVEGNIIRMFDPVNHEPLDDGRGAPGLDATQASDRRWIACQRPSVTVGGELTLDALDLAYNPALGFYRAPIQAVANGGVLIIDDFGRQHCSPRDLLNRWIVPLESRVDYLTLRSGLKFELPFQLLVVFATNIKPAELVDEAFLRRIQYKIFVDDPTVADFVQIFENHCQAIDVPFEPALVNRLLDEHYKPRGIEMRGCQPRDLVNQALALAEYRGEPRRLNFELLEAACASYFIEEFEAPPARA